MSDSSVTSTQFKLVFQGLTDTSAPALQRLKGILIADFDLSVTEVQSILQGGSREIMKARREVDLLKAFKLLKGAGADVLIVRPIEQHDDSDITVHTDELDDGVLAAITIDELMLSSDPAPDDGGAIDFEDLFEEIEIVEIDPVPSKKVLTAPDAPIEEPSAISIADPIIVERRLAEAEVVLEEISAVAEEPVPEPVTPEIAPEEVATPVTNPSEPATCEAATSEALTFETNVVVAEEIPAIIAAAEEPAPESVTPEIAPLEAAPPVTEPTEAAPSESLTYEAVTSESVTFESEEVVVEEIATITMATAEPIAEPVIAAEPATEPPEPAPSEAATSAVEAVPADPLLAAPTVSTEQSKADTWSIEDLTMSLTSSPDASILESPSEKNLLSAEDDYDLTISFDGEPSSIQSLKRPPAPKQQIPPPPTPPEPKPLPDILAADARLSAAPVKLAAAPDASSAPLIAASPPPAEVAAPRADSTTLNFSLSPSAPSAESPRASEDLGNDLELILSGPEPEYPAPAPEIPVEETCETTAPPSGSPATISAYDADTPLVLELDTEEAPQHQVADSNGSPSVSTLPGALSLSAPVASSSASTTAAIPVTPSGSSISASSESDVSRLAPSAPAVTTPGDAPPTAQSTEVAVSVTSGPTPSDATALPARTAGGKFAKKIRAIPREVTVALVSGIVILGGANWIYFKVVAPTERTEITIAIPNPAAQAKVRSKAPQPPPAQVISARFKGENTADRLQVTGLVAMAGDEPVAAHVAISGPEPAPRTVDEIVHDIPSPPWLKRAEIDVAKFTNTGNDRFLAGGAAKLYIEYNDRRGRLTAPASVSVFNDKATGKVVVEVAIAHNLTAADEKNPSWILLPTEAPGVYRVKISTTLPLERQAEEPAAEPATAESNP